MQLFFKKSVVLDVVNYTCHLRLMYLVKWGGGVTESDQTETVADLVADAGYERFDVQLCGTRLLTRSVCTLETSSGFPQRRSLAQCRVLYVVKVVPFASTRLRILEVKEGGG